MQTCKLSDNGLTPLRAAAYVRMSTDRQEYSTRNQLDAIEEYARVHAIEIVKIYEDSGRSGLTAQGRPALLELLNDVQGEHDFHIVLVYDVSRWGRFQDIDESAYYQVHCLKHGVNVTYCAEHFSNDGSLEDCVRKVIARAGAAKFSRDLSVKVFAGQCRLVRLGYKPGGPAGYGLRRLLIREDGTPVCVLEHGERKAIQNYRVILVPGPAYEVAVVNQIFEWYAEQRIGDRRIAKALNAANIVNEFGGKWKPDMIRRMVQNEKYIGNLIFNRSSFKLHEHAVRNPPECWVRCDAAFPSIVSPSLFKTAQLVRAKKSKRYSESELRSILLQVYRRHGRITGSLIDQDPDAPSVKLIARHFGTLIKAYDAAGIPHRRANEFVATRARVYGIRSQLQLEIEALSRQAGVTCERLPMRYFLRLSGTVTLSVRTLCCRHELRYGYTRWQGPAPTAIGADFILAAQLDTTNTKITRYLLISAFDIPGRSFEFTETRAEKFKIQSERLSDFFGRQSTGFIC